MEKVQALSCFRSRSEAGKSWWGRALLALVLLALLVVAACLIHYDGARVGRATLQDETQAQLEELRDEQQAEIEVLKDAHQGEMEATIAELMQVRGELVAAYGEMCQMREELEAWRNGTIEEYRNSQEDWLAIVP